MEVFAYLSGRILLQIFFILRNLVNPVLIFLPADGSLRHLREPVTKGVDDQFQTIRDFELGKHGAEVMCNGRLADE